MLRDEPDWLAAEHSASVAALTASSTADVFDLSLARVGREPDSDGVDSSFQPVNLGPVLAGNYTQPTPTILRRSDGQALLYEGQINGFHADSGTGKGWVSSSAIADEMRRGHTVVLIDLEDTAPSIVARLRLLGASDTDIAERLVYVRPAAAFGWLAVDHLARLVSERAPTLVVIDSLGEAFGLDGIDENSDAEVGPWLRRVPRRLADLGPAVVLVDHSTKANDNPLHPSGSKRKRAAIGGASYVIEARTPLVAGQGGRLRLTCAKDRHGTYARGEHAADWVMTTDDNGTRWALYEPDSRTASSELPVILAARTAVDICREAGEALSVRAITERMRGRIKASSDTKRAGVDEAIRLKALSEADGPRGARLLSYAAELPEVTS